MRLALTIVLLFFLDGRFLRAQSQEVPAVPPATPAVEAETVASSPPPASQAIQRAPAAEGLVDPQQVTDLLRRLGLTEYRVSDLLTEVRPERWKMSEAGRGSFQETLGTLRQQLESLAGWRAQFEARPDSMYLAYMTHASIDAILPRLDSVTRIITQRENASLGAQFSQSGNQLFDLQQALQPYLVYLLQDQDQTLHAAQSNLAGCETRLGLAMRGQSEPARVMKNIVPEFKGLRVRKQPGAAPHGRATSVPSESKPQGPPKKK